MMGHRQGAKMERTTGRTTWRPGGGLASLRQVSGMTPHPTSNTPYAHPRSRPSREPARPARTTTLPAHLPKPPPFLLSRRPRASLYVAPAAGPRPREVRRRSRAVIGTLTRTCPHRRLNPSGADRPVAVWLSGRVADVNWPDVMGAIGGVAGVLAALGVGLPAGRAARRSAKAAEDSADEARAVARIQREQRHDQLRPRLPEAIEADTEPAEYLGKGGRAMIGEITLPRDYRGRALAASGESEWLVGLPNDGTPGEGLLRGGRPLKIRIADIYPDRQGAVDEIRFRFWPPAPTDDVEHWTCPCERPPDDGGRFDAPGHWEIRVPVSYYEIMDSLG